ncbi:MAG: hypothetical protein ACQEP1_05140 [Nanobdellota archaeon]
MRKELALITLLMVALMLAGCEGSTEQVPEDTVQDTGEDEETQTQETETSPEEENEPADTEEDTGDNAEEEPADESLEEFRSIAEKNPEYKVTYDVTTSSGKEETVTIYSLDGEGRIDAEGQYKAWLLEDKTVVESSNGDCIDLSNMDVGGFDPESLHSMTTLPEGKITSDDKSLTVTSEGTRSIAGKSTDCYEFVYEKEGVHQVSTYCVTDRGIPAFVETIDKNNNDELISKAEASSIEDSPSSSDMEPCEPNMDIPSMG